MLTAQLVCGITAIILTGTMTEYLQIRQLRVDAADHF